MTIIILKTIYANVDTYDGGQMTDSFGTIVNHVMAGHQ